MPRSWLALAGLLVSATAHAEVPPPPVTDDRCHQAPPIQVAGFRHTRSRLLRKTGAANHRGIDVVAHVDDARQEVAGKLAYGRVDKDIEDEDVEVFACRAATWQSVGTARTDDDGRFSLVLEGAARLPPGMRDMYVAAKGDGTGARFVAYVAAKGESVVITDVDGRLTASENAIIGQVAAGRDVAARPHAAAGLAASPHVVIYVTARGDVFTSITRRWLERRGFPRGVMRLARGAFARPGSDASAFKASVFGALTVPIAAGVGNRKSDIVAYSRAKLPGTQILIYLPEYEREVRADLTAGNAVGFADYRKLPTLLPPRATP